MCWQGRNWCLVDVRPDTMNIDETKIEAAITDKTKVIMVMHYAGVACEMDTIMEIAHRHNLMGGGGCGSGRYEHL